MLKEDKEKISNEIIKFGGKIHDLITTNNQDVIYEIIDELRELQNRIFNL